MPAPVPAPGPGHATGSRPGPVTGPGPDPATAAASGARAPTAPADTDSLPTAHERGLVGCTECGRASPMGTRRCPRCSSRLHPPSAASLQVVWAWLVVGMIFYLPANVFPMLRTTLLGRTTDNTIIGGAVDLARHGNWGVAGIVLVASVLIPVSKFLAIGWLALEVRAGHAGGPGGALAPGRTRLYHIVDFIGRWSMIDVFVVAILAALVQMQFLAAIRPGIAAVSFCVSVVFTMLSAQAFDSRLIWLRPAGRPAPRPPAAPPGAAHGAVSGAAHARPATAPDRLSGGSPA